MTRSLRPYLAMAALLGAVGCGGSALKTTNGSSDLATSHPPIDLAQAQAEDFAFSGDGGIAHDFGSGVPDLGAPDLAPVTCTEITVSMFKTDQADGKAADYIGASTPDTGDDTDPDSAYLEFYGPGTAASYDGDQTGTFDLTKNGDENYATCSRCIRFVQDPDVSSTVFFPSSGTLNVDMTSDQLNGTVHTTLTDVTLVEVTIDGNTFTSTPVPGGQCLHIATATIDVAPVVVPAAWKCLAAYYSDNDCDCGCGAPDPACATTNVTSCAYCDDDGSCNTADCPGTIKPDDNSTCTPAG